MQSTSRINRLDAYYINTLISKFIQSLLALEPVRPTMEPRNALKLEPVRPTIERRIALILEPVCPTMELRNTLKDALDMLGSSQFPLLSISSRLTSFNKVRVLDNSLW